MSELSLESNTESSLRSGAALSTSSDHMRMSRLGSGDEGAMQELLQAHGDMLARLVGRLTAWHADSDDILQDILVVIWQKASTYQGQGSLEGWLKRIAVNRCRNHFRMTNTIRRHIEKFALLRHAELHNDESVFPPESNEPLQVALRKLTSADRAVVVLFYLEQMPGEEVAQSLGIKHDTLHVRLHRVRKKLKHLLEESGGEHGHE